ncbi:ATP-dependent helicase [Candidatus Saccharibacteria bacterium]|nr:ATP-dependent helicase [Candidatus Saccharibacteria bacterium]
MIDKTVAPLMSLSSVIRESLQFALKQDEGTNKTKHTGKWKSDWMQTVNGIKGMHKQRRANNKWLALADIYGTYRNELHHRGYYDYADMLLEVIVQLEQNADLRSDIQERFNYVLVDEFQDSNAAQLRLAHLIADHHTANNRPNIMAVGDDDQSIYGFNGAELNNMLHFNRTYDNVQTIVLTENYRSTQAILDSAETIIDHCEDRLVHRLDTISKQLTAKNNNVPPGTISHLVFKDPDHQLNSVAKRVGRLFAENTGSVAVLARSHDSLVALASILNNHNVPIRYERDQNILELDIVQQIIELSRVLNGINTGDVDGVNLALSRTLAHPMWGLDAELIWRIARDNRSHGDWLTSLTKYTETTDIKPWLSWLAEYAQREHFFATLEHLVGIRTSEDGFRSPIYRYFIGEGGSPKLESLRSLSALRLIRSHVYEFTHERRSQLDDFLQLADTLAANNITLSDQSVFVSGERAVELLSVHKAKGLEFDAVFIIDCQDDDWKPRTSKNKPPANLPLQPPLETMDDYARLMYVASTRAKSNLYLTSYDHNRAGEDTLATPLIASISTEHIGLEGAPESILILEEALRWPRLTVTKEKLLLTEQLESFTLNATNLINFLDVSGGGPQLFLERNLLKLPTGKSTYMSHGTAMHAALERAQKLVNRDAFGLDVIKAEYQRSLEREHLPINEELLQLEEGYKALDRLFSTHNYQLLKGSAPERSLSDITVGDATISGKLDRIDFLDDTTIRIVDYKTGKPLTSFETKDKTKEIKAWKYKLQLTLYALLAHNSTTLKQYTAVIGQMAFIEANAQKEITLEYRPTPEDIERLAQVINAVWLKVKNYDLPDTSHYEPTLAGIMQFERDLIADAV